MRLFITILIVFFNSCAKPQQTTINGAGGSITINGSGLTQQINGPFYYPAQSGDITFTDRHFQFSIPGYAGINYTARSTAGYVEFRTSETAISVKVGGNWSTASSSIDAQSDCEVLVDGVYNQSVRLTADDVTQTYAITLPAGEKIVRLVNGYTANPQGGTILLPNAGVYVQGVVTTGPIEIAAPYPTLDKWLFVGNSITVGANATHPVVTGFMGLFRADGRDIQSDSWGARRLLTFASADAEDMAAWVSAEMDGTRKNELFLLLGTNNFGLSGGQPKSTFKTEYQNFLDSLHSIRPDIIIYCISPTDRDNYSTPNSQGATCEDYADAIQELLVTRTWAKFIYGKDLVSLANMPDGLHPNQTGHQQYHDNLLIAYNALQ